MKKILLIAIMFVTYNVADAQIAYGIKGGLNYNLADISGTSDLKVDNKAGFHVGGFLRVKIPIVGLYVQAEPTYTKLNTELTSAISGEATNLGTNRFDLPVLLGWKMLGMLRIYGGPVLSWNLGSKVDQSDIDLVTEDNYSMGGQFGVGVELGSIMLDARYEAGISHAMKMTGTDTGDVNFDNRGSQIILGVAYKF
jgi:hypothetical protein